MPSTKPTRPKPENSCPVCKSITIQPYQDKNGFQILRCGNCGLAFVTNPPKEEGMAHFYAESYLPYFRLYGNYQEKAEERYRLLEREVKGEPGSLLDVGCSYGFFLNVARRNGWRVKGVEMGPKAAEHARSIYGLDVFQGSLDQAHIAPMSLNVVTIFHVIEHVQDPLALLSSAGNLLQKGGLLLLLTPNVESLHSRLLGKGWTWLHPPDHLLYFTERSLGSALRKSGFQVTTIRSTTVDADNLLMQMSASMVRTQGTSKSEIAFRSARLFRIARLFSDRLLLPEKLLCSLVGREDEIFAVATKL